MTIGEGGKMSMAFNDEWLQWAVKVEDEAGCDIEAGLNFGQHSGEYLAKTQNYIDPEKLMAILREELGTLLSQAELQKIVDAMQKDVHNRIREKVQSTEVA
jgi:hypothetical protein